MGHLDYAKPGKRPDTGGHEKILPIPTIAKAV